MVVDASESVLLISSEPVCARAGWLWDGICCVIVQNRSSKSAERADARFVGQVDLVGPRVMPHRCTSSSPRSSRRGRDEDRDEASPAHEPAAQDSAVNWQQVNPWRLTLAQHRAPVGRTRCVWIFKMNRSIS